VLLYRAATCFPLTDSAASQSPDVSGEGPGDKIHTILETLRDIPTELCTDTCVPANAPTYLADYANTGVMIRHCACFYRDVIFVARKCVTSRSASRFIATPVEFHIKITCKDIRSAIEYILHRAVPIAFTHRDILNIICKHS